MRYLFILLLFVGSIAYGQQFSPNRIDYKITFDTTQQQYTVWVVPLYSTPNSNNTDAQERGATAQVTIAVPSKFYLNSLTDVVGVWDKVAFKLGPGMIGQDWTGFSLPANTHYYVIGKNILEVNYGKFTANEPVALFRFRGNGCFGDLRIINPNEPFIDAASQKYNLNVGNSFYSISGQPPGGNQVPLEQFRGVAGSPASCKTLAACAALECVNIQAGIIVR